MLADIDFIGIATVIAALGSSIAAVVGAMNRGTVKDSNRTAHRVEDSTDALHVKVDNKLSEHEAIVATLATLAAESAERAKLMADLWRKEHPA